eukprot:5975156-Prymnesium_polylepis.1
MLISTLQSERGPHSHSTCCPGMILVLGVAPRASMHAVAQHVKGRARGEHGLDGHDADACSIGS